MGTHRPAILEQKHLITVVMSSEKYHAVRGEHYYIDFVIPDLDLNDTAYVLFEIPLGVYGLFAYVINSIGLFDITLYEGTTTTSTGGMALIPLNNDRNSSNTSDISIYVNPLVAVEDGTIIKNLRRGSTASGGRIQGSEELQNVIISKANTKYLLKFQSGLNGNYVSGTVAWSEENGS